jgi:hypothetical protein
MNIKDFAASEPWVVALKGFSPLVARYNASRGEWQWHRQVFKATTFPTKEEAERCLSYNRKMCEFIARTVPSTERGRVKPAKVKMTITFDD